MHREVNLILEEYYYLNVSDIESILHEMNPNIVVTEETTLSFKQAIYLYEHLADQQITVDSYENVEIVVSNKSKQEGEKQKNNITKAKNVHSNQEQKNLDREKSKISKSIASCYRCAISEIEIHRCCEKLSKKTKDERILQMIKELESKYCDKIRKNMLILKPEDKENYSSKNIRLRKKRTPVSLHICLTDEERRERNGDKRIKKGYSSTGVKIPSHQELVNMSVEKQKKNSTAHYKRRSRAKMFISVCMGGQNKRY